MLRSVSSWVSLIVAIYIDQVTQYGPLQIHHIFDASTDKINPSNLKMYSLDIERYRPTLMI